MMYRSYIAIPSNSWVDDFIDWLNPGSRCCRLYTTPVNFGKFCPASERKHRSKKKPTTTHQTIYTTNTPAPPPPTPHTHTITHNRLSFFVTTASKKCLMKCIIPSMEGVVRPNVSQFNRFFPIFVDNRPDLQCPKGCVLPFAYSQYKLK